MTAWLTRLGTAIGVSALAAAVATIPAAIRVAAGDCPGCRASSVWLVLSGVALIPMLAAVLLFRGGRVGIKAFGGPGTGTRAAGLVLWACLEVCVSFAFAMSLRATTHHHALAGVTFGLGSLGVSALIALGVMRTARIVSALSPGSRRAAFALGAVALVLGGALVARSVGRDPSSGMAAAEGTIVDLLAFFIVATFASRPEFAARRALALLGPPGAIALLALALHASGASPPIAAAMKIRAPLYAEALASWGPH